MGVKLLFLCVYCQTVINISLGAIELPFLDLEETVIPVKPSSSLPAENELPSLSSPTMPKSIDAILELIRSKYLDFTKSTENENSSPLVTSSSNGLPISKIEGSQVSEPIFSNIIPQSSTTLPVLPYQTNFRYKPNTITSLPNTLVSTIPNSNVFSLPCVTSLPIISVEALKRSIESLNGVSSSSYLPRYYPSSNNKLPYTGCANVLYSVPYPLRYNQVLLPQVLPPSSMMPSYLNTFPVGRSCTDKFNTYTPSSTQFYRPVSRGPQPSASVSENSNKIVTNRVPRVPSSILTSSKSCSEAQHLDNMRYLAHDPLRDRLVIDKAEPVLRAKKFDLSYSPSDFNSWNLYSPLRPLPEPSIPELSLLDFTPPIFDFDKSPLRLRDKNTDFSNNFIVPDIQPTIDAFIDTIDCNLHENIDNFLTGIHFNTDVPKIPSAIPNFIPLRELSIENTIPDISVMSLPADLYFNTNDYLVSPKSRVKNMPGTYSKLEKGSSPAMKQPPKLPATSVIPAAYINVSPTYALSKTTANAISSLNDVVSNMTQNILSTFMTYLTSAITTPKIPSTTLTSNPYGLPLPKYPYSKPPPSLNIFNGKILTSAVPQFIYTPQNALLNTLSSYDILPAVPVPNSNVNTLSSIADCSASFYDDISSSTFTSSSIDAIAPISDNLQSPPIKVSLLPQISLVDYSLPQPCPSILPSPILPSFLDISVPISTQPQVLNIKYSDRKHKRIENLLELVFLAELLNGEGYIDWDALEAVMAVLYAS